MNLLTLKHSRDGVGSTKAIIKVDYFFCFQASDKSAFEKQNIAVFSSQKCGEGNLKKKCK